MIQAQDHVLNLYRFFVAAYIDPTTKGADESTALVSQDAEP